MVGREVGPLDPTDAVARPERRRVVRMSGREEGLGQGLGGDLRRVLVALGDRRQHLSPLAAHLLLREGRLGGDQAQALEDLGEVLRQEPHVEIEAVAPRPRRVRHAEEIEALGDRLGGEAARSAVEELGHERRQPRPALRVEGRPGLQHEAHRHRAGGGVPAGDHDEAVVEAVTLDGDRSAAARR